MHTVMKKNKQLRSHVVALVLRLSLLLFQLACLVVLYSYYQYGGSYRPKTGAKLFVESGDPVYLIVLLMLLPFTLISLSHVFTQLKAMIKGSA